MKTYHSELGDVYNSGEKWYIWDVIDQKKEIVITKGETHTIIKPVYGWCEITEEEAKKYQQYGWWV